MLAQMPSTPSNPGAAATPPPSFQPAFNARLIAEVKKYPCLYNHAKRGSGDTNERMRIWDTIAAAVDQNCTGEFAKKRWLQLRDRYRKELKVAIRQNFLTPVRWCYFSHLSWLDPYLKDNLALATSDSLYEPDLSNASFDITQFAEGLKQDIDEGYEANEMEPSMNMFESCLDRVLAATHRHESTSPTLENDESGPQSVGTSGDEEKVEPFDNPKDNQEPISTEEANNLLQVLQPSNNFSIKDSIIARQAQQQNMMKQIYQQAARSAVDWVNDEDMLYSRIIGVKLRKMDPKKRKRVRAQIMSLLEDSDEDDDTASAKRACLEESQIKEDTPEPMIGEIRIETLLNMQMPDHVENGQ